MFSLAAKIALICFETPEIAKMLHNVYRNSCIGKYLLRKAFTVDWPCSDNPRASPHIKTISIFSRLVKTICDLIEVQIIVNVT
jgi:hypothetical protein